MRRGGDHRARCFRDRRARAPACRRARSQLPCRSGWFAIRAESRQCGGGSACCRFPERSPVAPGGGRAGSAGAAGDSHLRRTIRLASAGRRRGTVVVRVLTFLQGEPLSGVRSSIALRRALGETAARLDMALRDFAHPASAHELMWDLQQASAVRTKLAHIGDLSRRALAERFLDTFEIEARPRLADLRAQVIHNDLTLTMCWLPPMEHASRRHHRFRRHGTRAPDRRPGDRRRLSARTGRASLVGHRRSGRGL